MPDSERQRKRDQKISRWSIEHHPIVGCYILLLLNSNCVWNKIYLFEIKAWTATFSKNFLLSKISSWQYCKTIDNTIFKAVLSGTCSPHFPYFSSTLTPLAWHFDSIPYWIDWKTLNASSFAKRFYRRHISHSYLFVDVVFHEKQYV